MIRRLSHLFVLLLPALPATGESFMMLDRTGVITPVQLTIMGPDEVEVVDSEEGFQTRSRDECVAFLRPTPSPTTIDRPTVLLRDGQRFPGRLSSQWVQDHLVWDHEWLGTLRIPVDRIDRISLVGSSRIQPHTSDSDVDRVHLLNGDMVEGFILSITPRLEVEVDSDAGPRVVEIPMDRVREIDLFGDMEAGSDPRVWTNDGTMATLGVLEVASDGYLRMGDHEYRHGGVSSMLSGPPLRSIHALSCTGSQVVPIGSLPVLRQETPSIRLDPAMPQVTDPTAPLGLSPVEFRGPLLMEYALPDGPHRLHATVRMPTSATRWGDCELVLLVDGEEIHRSSYNADRIEHRLDLAVEGEVFTIRMLEGANGPVQDHLRFEYGILMPTMDSAVRTLDEPTEGVGGTTGID